MFLVFAPAAASDSRGAEFHIEPSIKLTGEYNDNILLEDDDEKEEYIARTMLGLGIEYTSLRFDLDILYAPEYRYFVNYDDYGGEGDNDEIVHFLNAQGRYIFINNLLYIEASDVYERVSLDTTRDYTKLSSFLNQSDRNTFTLNPYIRIRPASLLTMNTGYKYIDVWYDSDEGIGGIDNIAYVDLNYELSRNTVLTAGYRFTMEEREGDADVNDFNMHDVSVGGRYEYREGSTLSLEVGYSDLDYEEGNRYNYPFWNVGITHQIAALVTSFNTFRYLNADPTGDPRIVDRYGLAFRSSTYQAFPENPNSISGPKSGGAGGTPGDDLGRTTFNLSFYLNGFTDTTPDDIDSITYGTDYDTVTYGTSASLYHLFSRKTIGNIEFTGEIEEDRDPDTYSSLYLAGARLIYLPTRDINLALSYAYTDSYSPDIEDDNFRNNKVIFRISKTF